MLNIVKIHINEDCAVSWAENDFLSLPTWIAARGMLLCILYFCLVVHCKRRNSV